MPVHLVSLGRLFHCTLLMFDAVQQAEAIAQPKRAAFRQREHRRLKDRVGGVPEIVAVEPKAIGAGAVAEGALGGDIYVPCLPACPEPPGILPGPHSAGFVDTGLRQDDRRRQVVAARREISHQRGDRRILVAVGHRVDVKTRWQIEPAGEQHVTGDLVSAIVRAGGANQGIALAAFGEKGQVLANLHARRPRGDWAELTAHVVRRIRL